MRRKDLERVFSILDRQRAKRIRLDDLKGVASLIHDAEGEEQGSLAFEEEENLKGLAGEALIRR